MSFCSYFMRREPSFLFGGNACNGVNLHLQPAPKHRLNGGSRRSRAGEELRIRRIEAVEIFNSGKIATALHHILKPATGLLQHFPYGVQSALRLLADAAADDLARLQILRRMPTHKKPSIAAQSGGIRAGAGTFVGMFQDCLTHGRRLLLTKNLGEKKSPPVPSHPQRKGVNPRAALRPKK